jgi:hypothetical protein
MPTAADLAPPPTAIAVDSPHDLTTPEGINAELADLTTFVAGDLDSLSESDVAVVAARFARRDEAFAANETVVAEKNAVLAERLARRDELSRHAANSQFANSEVKHTFRPSMGGSVSGGTFTQPRDRDEWGRFVDPVAGVADLLKVTNDYAGAGKSRTVSFTLGAFREACSVGTYALVDASSPTRPPNRVEGVKAQPDRKLKVLDLVNRVSEWPFPTSYLRESSYTNAAAEVAEGAQKPESAITFIDVPITMRTIAHHLPVTRMALKQNNWLLGHLNQRLIYGVERRFNDQILNGDGVSPNLGGIVAAAGLSYTSIAADSKLRAIRRGITLSQTADCDISAILLNPLDWETIEGNSGVVQSTQGQGYVLAGFASSLYSVPVIPTASMPSGKALLLDAMFAATVYDEGAVELYMSDSHANNFTENKTELLAEIAGAIAIDRPNCMVRVDLTAAAAA